MSKVIRAWIGAGAVGPTELNSDALGNGLTGGSGTTVAVGQGTGITVNAGDVAIDTTSIVTFADDAATAWTFPVGTASQGGFVTGTPQDANHMVNKSYVDSAISGLTWVEPADVINLIGNATIATINGLTPAAGDAYVATDAGTPTAGTSDALVAGSLAEYDGTSWQEIVAGSGGFVADGVRAALSTATALIAPYTDATDDGKIVAFDGTSLTGVDTSEAVDGNAVLINSDGSYNEHNGYVFDGTVATGTWQQFTGAGQINAGTGLTKSGNTIDAGAGNGITVAADTIAVNPDSTTGGDTAAVTVAANGVGVDVTTLDGDHLDVDFTPTNYTPATTPAESASVDDLAAHLYGVDQALAGATGETTTKLIYTLDETGNSDITNGSFDIVTDAGGAAVQGAGLVSITPVGGPQQTSRQWTAAAGADYDIATNAVLINNNSAATDLTDTGAGEVWTDGDVLIIEYVA